MSKEFIAAIKQIAAEKNINEEAILEAVCAALATAYRKEHGNRDQEIEVKLNGDSIEGATVYIVKEVVKDIEDENFEISLKDAKKLDKNAKLGDELRIDVTPIGYGRIATQAAKQVMHQKIQEAERMSMFDKFKSREGNIIYGTINRVEGTNVIIDIEQNLVQLAYKNQVKQEQYFVGKRISLYLEKVHNTAKGPSIIISRSSPKLIEKLLEREIPEIMDGNIEIKSIARDPGNRTKIAVYSNNSDTDPIGACVGSKGSRINLITDELGGERIDMLEWDPNPAKFISRTLQPAKVAKVIIVNAEEGINSEGRFIKKRAAVFVEESQRAMAIGKKGQNIRLATELTGFELDMYNIEELGAFEIKLKELKHDTISYSNDEEGEPEEKTKIKASKR